MHLGKRIRTLVLAGALSLALAAPALAAGYTDLPSSHWAYDTMTKAASLGILQGTGDGRIDPSGTLSWGQFLVMLDRTFAPGSYENALATGLSWDQAGLQAALSSGLLLPEDGLAVTDGGSLSDPVTRQDAALLLGRVLPEGATASHSIWDFWFGTTQTAADASTFTDWDQMDAARQEAVAALAKAGVVQGQTDGSFGYADPLQRADAATLLVRVLDKVDQEHNGEEKTVTFHFVDSTTGAAILPDQRTTAAVGYSVSSAADTSGVGYYYDVTPYYSISTACDEYTLLFEPMTQAQIQEEQFWEKVDRGEATAEDYFLQDFWLQYPDENPRKYLLLFGSEDKRRFDSEEEAAAAMTTVSFPVWKLSSDGSKVGSTLSVTVHAAIAQDVVDIFTEIYNDPEQFPIYSVGGYAWRGDSATGEHNCGTAIDINANENFQVRDGQTLAGSFWDPAGSPYSIPANGSVVRIFAEHGWSWGGDAWAWDSDPAEGYHDYMHFSYMGG
ncbi:MAG TPA: S-layer homology domain-containing protein [Candidatus Intestinimonas pullistercoris]|uniref:S-layer homology domain-containing protein n=1 Tax=Candidatus Intestinimonas pullistercoris TaxID=2838623 RepID=A0A9D2NZX4_9FIRM|nr:S-layer homology domain-containing protein [Candidatus Intestinimonas pullistercoris]